MGSANSQSPVCWQEAAKNDARWCIIIIVFFKIIIIIIYPQHFDPDVLQNLISYKTLLNVFRRNVRLPVYKAVMKQDCLSLVVNTAEAESETTFFSVKSA